MADLAEGRERVANEARHAPARVDDRVERASGERAEVAVAVAAELFDAGEQVGPRPAAVEQGHVVTAFQGGVDHVAAEEERAAEDEDPHTLSLW